MEPQPRGEVLQARVIVMPCDFVQAGVIGDPFRVTVKTHLLGFAGEEFKRGHTQGKAAQPRWRGQRHDAEASYQW